MKKKLSLLFAMLMLMVAFVGCSSSSEGDQADKVSEVVEVDFWHGYTTEKTEALEELIARYEKENPTVKINAKFVASGEEMLQKVQTALLSDQQPDMLWGYPTWTGVLESSGKLVEIGSLVDDELKNDLPEGVLNAGEYKGKIYSLPIEAGTLYMIYNKDMFEAAGIDAVPTTWDELYDVTKTLTKDGQYGIWLPIDPNERTTWTWETFLWQNGGNILNATSDGIGFNDEKGLEALEFYTKIIKDGYAPMTVGQDPFIDEQVAIVYATQGAANAYINKYEMNVGVAMLPGQEKLATGLGSNHYFMLKSDEVTERETMKFMKWMLTGDTHAEWAIRAGYLPVSESAKSSERYEAYGKENPHMIIAAEALTHGVARPSLEEYPKLSSAISGAIEKIVYGELTAEEGLEEISTESEKIFK
jgi:ABC-type glycerol-3-phosphate transport system substrate-binding protein